MQVELKHKVEHHKKLFESYWIDQKNLSYKGNVYHMAFYKRFNKDTGGIFFTLRDENVTKEEYLEAFELYTLLLTRYGKTLKYGTERKNINMIGFEKTNTYLNDVQNNTSLTKEDFSIINSLHDSIEQILDYQKQLSNLMNRFNNFIKSKEPKNIYTPEDVDEILKMNAELDYLQNRQINLLIDSTDEFKLLQQIIQHNPDLSNAEINKYIAEFTKGKEQMRQELAQATYIDTSKVQSKEEYMDAYIQDYIQRQRNSNKKIIKELRYPVNLT